MRCKSCHYSLANLTGPPHRCPECAAAFDPNDPGSYLTDRQITVDLRQRIVGTTMIVLAMLALVILATIMRRPLVLVFLLLPLLTIAVQTWMDRKR